MLTYFAFVITGAGVWATGTRMITVMVIACLFGASAAASIPALGNAPLTPAVFALPFLFFRAIRKAGMARIVHQAKSGPGPWLIVLVVWGVIGAFYLPRAFLGETTVFTTDRNSSLGVLFTPLRPNSTNINQTCYLIGGAATYFLMRALLRVDEQLDRFRKAVFLLVLLNFLAAITNLAEHYLGLPSVMEYVRNAQYAIIDGDEVGGLIRISGTFAEASAFSAFTFPLFAFTASLWQSGHARRTAGWLSILSLALLAFSTSTTAYAALLVYFALLLVSAGWRQLTSGRPLMLGPTAAVLSLSCAGVLATFLLIPNLVDRITDFFQLTLLSKLQSSSGIERSSWNINAWQNFLDSYGLGVGLGSARASSFPLALLSNLGALGTLAFVVFVFKIIRSGLSPRSSEGQPVVKAAAQAVVATLIASSVSGAVFDLGTLFYVFAAAASLGSCHARAPMARLPVKALHA